MTLRRHFHSAIFKPLCLFRNGVGLLCIGDSQSGGREEEEEEEGVEKANSTDGFQCEETN